MKNDIKYIKMTRCDFPQIVPRLAYLPFCAGAERDVWLQPGAEEEKISQPDERITQEVDLGDRLQAILHVRDGSHRQEDREEEAEVLPSVRRDSTEQDSGPLPGHLSSEDQDHRHLQRQLARRSTLRVPHGEPQLHDDVRFY